MLYRLLPQIDRSITSIGSNQFTLALHNLIMEKLDVDATHFQSIALVPSPNEPEQLLDDLITSSCGQLPPDEASCLSIHERTEHFQHSILVLRKAPLSDQEATQLNHLAPLLFSLLEQHLQSQRSRALVSTSIEERFQERLRETGMKLSEREKQVCLGLLAGHTAPQQAERLRLTVNTVGSYMRRATAKLGISGRNALMRWLYESSDTHAVSQLPPTLARSSIPCQRIDWIEPGGVARWHETKQNADQRRAGECRYHRQRRKHHFPLVDEQGE